jgi:putative DNA primase/helicase
MNIVTRFNLWIRSLAVVINTPPVRRTPANCTNINMLLMHLCDFNADHYSYILQWLAYPLRNPGAKMRYGLIFNADSATGSQIFKQIAIALHGEAARAIDADALSDRYTNWVGAALVVIDGRISQRSLARIKDLMTAATVNVDVKGKAPFTVPNGMNFVFVSGDRNPIRADVADRRFMVIETPPAREKVFYQAVRYEIENGGVDAFREYLMHGIDLDGFNETTLPPGLGRAGSNGMRARQAHAEREAA